MSQVASRYAGALFEIASEQKSFELTINELRAFENILVKNEEIQQFLTSPLVKPKQKEQALKAALEKNGVSEATQKFVLTLAKKNRLGVFSEIVKAFESKADEANGVNRGTVTSAGVLSLDERNEIQKTVEKVTKKRAILSFDQDPENIGGLVARVGSFTFDDTLKNHLRRLQEELKRRAH